MTPALPLPEIALLLVALGVLGWRAVTRERREFARFAKLRGTAARQRVYRRWLIESVAVIGGLSLAVTVGAAASRAPARAAAQAWGPIATARGWIASPVGLAVALVLLALAIAALIVPVLLVRGSLDDIPTVGDIRALLPRTRGELPYGAGLALSAGVFEELLFRLGLPALLFAIAGDGPLAFLIAGLVFGLLHLYQGPIGMLGATVLGLALAALYLVSGTIVLPIALHALIDLRSLVLIPVVLGGVGRPPRAAAAPDDAAPDATPGA